MFLKNFAVNKSTFKAKVITNGNHLYVFFDRSYPPPSFSRRTFNNMDGECRFYLVEPKDHIYACYTYHIVQDVIYNTQCNRLLACPKGYYFVLEKKPQPCFVDDVKQNKFIHAVKY